MIEKTAHRPVSSPANDTLQQRGTFGLALIHSCGTKVDPRGEKLTRTNTAEPFTLPSPSIPTLKTKYRLAHPRLSVHFSPVGPQHVRDAVHKEQDKREHRKGAAGPCGGGGGGGWERRRRGGGKRKQTSSTTGRYPSASSSTIGRLHPLHPIPITRQATIATQGMLSPYGQHGGMSRHRHRGRMNPVPQGPNGALRRRKRWGGNGKVVS